MLHPVNWVPFYIKITVMMTPEFPISVWNWSVKWWCIFLRILSLRSYLSTKHTFLNFRITCITIYIKLTINISKVFWIGVYVEKPEYMYCLIFSQHKFILENRLPAGVGRGCTHQLGNPCSNVILWSKIMSNNPDVHIKTKNKHCTGFFCL